MRLISSSKSGDNETFEKSSNTSFNNTIEEKVSKKIMKKDLREYILSLGLSDREFDILCSLWGIFDTDIKTCKEIGEKYSISEQRVKQIEAKTLMKLRINSDVKTLSSYLDKPEEADDRLDQYIELYYSDSKNMKKTLLDNDFFKSVGMNSRISQRKK